MPLAQTPSPARTNDGAKADTNKIADDRIPEVVIGRLPIYARELAFLVVEKVATISSLELGDRLRVTPAQIRKDLSYFGEFGKQGTGYDVGLLLGEINRILGLDREWPMVIVGVGKLGEAVATYAGFRDQGFRVAAIFDNDPKKIGTKIGNFPVVSLENLGAYVRENAVTMGIVAVPAEHAQAVVNVMVENGIRGILNYAPISIRTPHDVQVRNIDPIVQLQSTTYYLKDLVPTNDRDHSRDND